jgi:hypothetical protein
MNEEKFFEYRYALRHKPTKKWVEFENDEIDDFTHYLETLNKKYQDLIIQ